VGAKSPLGASVKGGQASVSREPVLMCLASSVVSTYLKALIINANVKMLKGSPRGLPKGRRSRNKQCCIVLIRMGRQSRKGVRRAF
jgi:hypothetical protein